MTTPTDLAARLRDAAKILRDIGGQSAMAKTVSDGANALEAAQKARREAVAWALTVKGEDKFCAVSLDSPSMPMQYREWACTRYDATPLYTTPQAGEGWMPIESAPKDGRDFFAIEAYSLGTPEYSVCYWHELVRRFVAPDERFDPTHWMPLPPPPAMEADSD